MTVNRQLAQSICRAVIGVAMILSMGVPGTLWAQQAPPAAVEGTGSIPPAFNLNGAANSVDSEIGLVRIKDVTTIAGHRSHTLEGIGLVMGLKGTGGRSLLAQRLFQNYLKGKSLLVDDIVLNTTNLSVVTVSGEVPPFTSPGEKFFVNVSVADDATSLRNGMLMNTELVAFDNEVYAVASGPIVMGGYSAEGAAAGVQVNHDTVGKVHAQLEVELCGPKTFPENDFRLLLRNKDYATALQISRQINALFPNSATAMNAGMVQVRFPQAFHDSKMDYVVLINSLKFVPDQRAKVVINQKTGTVVVGSGVKITKVLFANSNLVITTNELPEVSQPAPLSTGETTVVPRTQISASEFNSRYSLLDGRTTVGELAGALNSLGVSPQDLISVFQSLAEQGYMQAELVIQ